MIIHDKTGTCVNAGYNRRNNKELRLHIILFYFYSVNTIIDFSSVVNADMRRPTCFSPFQTTEASHSTICMYVYNYRSVLLTNTKCRKHDCGGCLSRSFWVDNLKMSRFSPMGFCGVSTNEDSRLAGE